MPNPLEELSNAMSNGFTPSFNEETNTIERNMQNAINALSMVKEGKEPEKAEPVKEEVKAEPVREEVKAEPVSEDAPKEVVSSDTPKEEMSNVKDSEEAKKKRKRLTGFHKEEPQSEASIELPDEIKSKLALLDEMLEMPVVKLAYESKTKGENFVSKVVELEKINPDNMSAVDKFVIGLKRDGATEEEIADAIDDFEILKPYEQRDRVKDITKTLKKEYSDKIKAYKIEPKPYIDPEKAKEKYLTEAYGIIDAIKGKDFYGIEMDEANIKEFKEIAEKPLWNIDENGNPDLTDYLEAAWKVHNFEKALSEAVEIARKEGFNEGVMFKKDQDSNSGRGLKNNLTSKDDNPKESKEGTINWHLNNAPGLKNFFGS